MSWINFNVDQMSQTITHCLLQSVFSEQSLVLRFLTLSHHFMLFSKHQIIMRCFKWTIKSFES